MSRYISEDERAEYDRESDANKTWFCNVCHAQNSVEDGECQFCECEGTTCQRNTCSAPEHFHEDHIDTLEPECSLCDNLGIR
jgi:hypothetical protein